MTTMYLCVLDGCVFDNKRMAIIHTEFLLHKMHQSGMMGPDCYVKTCYAEDEKDKKLRKFRELIRDLEKDFE